MILSFIHPGQVKWPKSSFFGLTKTTACLVFFISPSKVKAVHFISSRIQRTNIIANKPFTGSQIHNVRRSHRLYTYLFSSQLNCTRSYTSSSHLPEFDFNAVNRVAMGLLDHICGVGHDLLTSTITMTRVTKQHGSQNHCKHMGIFYCITPSQTKRASACTILCTRGTSNSFPWTCRRRLSREPLLALSQRRCP
jgi:hypothetical protein